MLSASLGSEDKIKLSFVIQEDGENKKPHQAMLLVKDSKTDLEVALVIGVKAGGRASTTFVRDGDHENTI